MKKMMALLMGFVCAVSLCACGGDENVPGGVTHAITDVQAVVEDGAFSEELETVDADTAFMLYRLEEYGLVREDLVEAEVLRSAGATCEEIAVLTFSDAEKAAAAVNALNDYVERQIETNVDYRPNEIPKLEDATVAQLKDTIAFLAVVNDPDGLT